MDAAWAATPAAPVKGAVVANLSPLEASLLAAAKALRSGDAAKAVELYKPLVNASDDVQRAQARFGLALAFDHLGDDAQAVQVLEGSVADASALGRNIAELRAKLLLQLAGRDLAQGNPVRAQDWLGQYSHLTAQPDYERYQRLLKRAMPLLDASSTVPQSPVKVGVLLPLTGPLAATGADILRGLQLGLQKQPRDMAQALVLEPYDTAPGAAAAANAALASGAAVIAGPLLATDVEAVAEAAKAVSVTVIAFTTDRSVLYDNATSMGYLPAEQARAMADWAAGQGYSKVATLIPSSPYGSEVNDAFRDQAQKQGLVVAKSAFYNPQNVDLSATVRDLVGGKPVSGTAPFQAVFAPAPASSLPLITSQLAYFDLDKAGVQLMGTGLWQNSELLKPSANGAAGAVFAVPTQNSDVTRYYTESYGTAPSGGAAILGYDLAYVLGEAATDLRVNGVPLDASLYRPEGFYAPGGFVRFRAPGSAEGSGAERGLDIVKIEDGTFKVLVPALPQAPLPLPGSLTPQGARQGWKLFKQAAGLTPGLAV